MSIVAAPSKSGIIYNDDPQWPCLNMIGLGFNNTGTTIATVNNRTIAPGAAFPFNGDIPLSNEFLDIKFIGRGNNALEFTAQVMPAHLICNCNE